MRLRHLSAAAALLAVLLPSQSYSIDMSSVPLTQHDIIQVGVSVHSSPSFSRPATTYHASPPAISRPAIGGEHSNGGGQTYSRPGAASGVTVAPKGAVTPHSQVDTLISRGHSAQTLQAYRAETSKFKNPAVGLPPNRQAAQANPVWGRYGANRWASPNKYYDDRNRFIGGLPPARRQYWTSPPIYVIQGRPSYGSFSGAFYGSLLGYEAGQAISNSSAMWAYSHYNDEGYQQWHADMMAQAEQNAELQQKMAALDAQVAQLKANGTPVGDPTALPDGVDPSVAVAPALVLAATADEDDGGYLYMIGGTLGGIVLIGGLLYVIVRRRNRFGGI